MVIILFAFAMFFTVSDSVIHFKSPIMLKKNSDTLLILWYSQPVEEYEAGNYYYPSFVIEEVNVLKRKEGALVKIHYKRGREPILSGNVLILRHPQRRFYLKAKHASREDLKRLFDFLGFKFKWLDSLSNDYYTICGPFTEDKLKQALKNNGKQNSKKVKKR